MIEKEASEYTELQRQNLMQNSDVWPLSISLRLFVKELSRYNVVRWIFRRRSNPLAPSAVPAHSTVLTPPAQ